MVIDLVVDKVALVFALVEVVKSIDDKQKLVKFYPVISIFIGIGLAAILTAPDTFVLWQKFLISGLTYGLAASGLYSQNKSVGKRNR